MAVQAPTCATLQVSSQGIKIRMPGGVTLNVMTSVPSPDATQLSKALLAQANAALAPLSPIFMIIDAILALKGAIESIPDVIGPPPNPGAILDAISDVVKKSAKLANLIPQLAVPLMVIDVIDALILVMDGAISQLESVVLQNARILAAQTKANEPGNSALLAITVCATAENVKVQADIVAGLQPINSMFGVLNLFLGLIGLPEIPQMDELGGDAVQTIETLRGVTKMLQDVRNSIPIP
jgi:hypothetical protein